MIFGGSPSVGRADYGGLSPLEPTCGAGLWHCVNRVVSYVYGAISNPAEYVGKLIGANEEALSPLASVQEMAIVSHALHDFEESETLEEVAEFALEWFMIYL
jgi:hypothetical protein